MSELDDFLEHYGVKGMKWGKHLKDSGGSTSGSTKPPAHPDAVKAHASKTLAKKGSTDALSTADLQALVIRQNLERQYSTLNPTATTKGRKIMAELLVGVGKQQAAKALNDLAAKKLASALGK
jgi:hypothetical protein